MFLAKRDGYLRAIPGLHQGTMGLMPTKRERIDVLIDAHVWMRRQARIYSEWPPQVRVISTEAAQPNGDGKRRKRKANRDRRHIGGGG
jgi:hypothetical protein